MTYDFGLMTYDFGVWTFGLDFGLWTLGLDFGLGQFQSLMKALGLCFCFYVLIKYQGIITGFIKVY